MYVKIIKKPILKEELVKLAQKGFGDLVKAVIDVEKERMAIDGELHADEEAELLSIGSKQENLWGINLYPQKTKEEFIEFDSVINLKPSQNNRSRGVENSLIRKKIVEIVKKLVKSA